MNLLEQVVLGWECVAMAFGQLQRPALWVPWLLLGVLQALVLASLIGFAHPWVSPLVAPLLMRAAGDAVLHYPNLFRVLPGLYARADFLLAMVPGVLAAGASSALVLSVATGRPASAAAGLRRALGRGLALVVANLPFLLMVLALSFGSEAWLASRGSGGLVVRVVTLAVLLATLVLQALGLYATPLVMLGGMSPLAAWRELPHLLGRGGGTALTLVLLASVPLLPLQQLARISDRIVDRGRPELVAVLLAAEIALTLVVSALLTGAAMLAVRALEDEEAEWGG